jgi:histidyl-tRNA synthetase
LAINDGVTLQLNTLGDTPSRDAWRAALVGYFNDHNNALSEDSLARLEKNPLRILDSKDPTDRPVADAAPVIDDYLSGEAQDFFGAVTAGLDAAGVAWTRNAALVRGLDYYRHTAFEFVTDRLGAQGTVLGGGRYDGLIELLGGKSAPAVGFAIGVERLLDLWSQYQPEILRPECDVYIVHQGDEAQRRAALLAESLRDVGLAVIVHAGTASFKSQFKRADASAAAIAVILGGDELAAGVASVKMLRAVDQTSDTAQLSVPLDDLVAFLKDKVN